MRHLRAAAEAAPLLGEGVERYERFHGSERFFCRTAGETPALLGQFGEFILHEFHEGGEGGGGEVEFEVGGGEELGRGWEPPRERACL